MLFTPDETVLAELGEDDIFYDLNTGEASSMLELIDGVGKVSAISPDRSLLALHDQEINIYLWDAAAGYQLS